MTEVRAEFCSSVYSIHQKITIYVTKLCLQIRMHTFMKTSGSTSVMQDRGGGGGGRGGFMKNVQLSSLLFLTTGVSVGRR